MGKLYSLKYKGNPEQEETLQSSDFQEYSEELAIIMSELASCIYALNLNEKQALDLCKLVVRYATEAKKDGFNRGFEDATNLWIDTTMLIIGKYETRAISSRDIIGECLSKVLEWRKN